jgi:hypothetical protein
MQYGFGLYFGAMGVLLCVAFWGDRVFQALSLSWGKCIADLYSLLMVYFQCIC